MDGNGVDTDTTSSDIQPFHIDIRQGDLDDLQRRLCRIRWLDEVPGVGWDLGVPVDHLRDLTEHGRNPAAYGADPADCSSTRSGSSSEQSADPRCAKGPHRT